MSYSLRALFLSLALSTFGCAALRYGLDPHPFTDKVAYMELQPSRGPASSIGQVETKVCQGLLFSVIPMSDYPTWDDAKNKLVKTQDIKYMTNVETGRQNNSYGGVWKDNCLYLRGVAYK